MLANSTKAADAAAFGAMNPVIGPDAVEVVAVKSSKALNPVAWLASLRSKAPDAVELIAAKRLHDVDAGA